jgi:hypothetical protein
VDTPKKQYRISTFNGEIYTLEEYSKGPLFFGNLDPEKLKKNWEKLEEIEVPDDPKEFEKFRAKLRMIYQPTHALYP